MKRRIKCFIAMPFGRADCDALYERQISPLLTKLDIEPIRVDKREHKEDLNVFIMRMLETSDIALADLTYARPSVYYEAGYADSKCQSNVVYTVRKDHLIRGKADDGLRVHFDLEMKKIIQWQNPDDPTFSSRLKRRLLFFTKPLKEGIKDNLRQQDERKAFMALSVKEKISEIERQFMVKLQRRRFRTFTLDNFYRYYVHRYQPGRVTVAVKQVDDTCYYCLLLATDHLGKKQIVGLLKDLPARQWIESDNPIRHYIEHYVFVSLRNLTHSQFTSSVPDAAYDISKNYYTASPRGFFKHSIDRRGMIQIVPPPKGPKSIILHLMCPIDSLDKIRSGFSELAAKFPRGRTNKYAAAIGHKLQLTAMPPNQKSKA